MSDPRADQIAKIKDSIAALEEEQRATGVDQSRLIQLQREQLAQLEQASSVSTASNISGGIDMQAESIDIAGDVVGRDKIELHTEAVQYTATVTGSGTVVQGDNAVAAGAGGVAVKGDVHGDVIVTTITGEQQYDVLKIRQVCPF